MPMSLQVFVGKLQALNSQAVKDTGPSEELRIQPDFALESDLDKAGRFIYHALATVVHQRLAVEDWNDNDYAYIAVLARGLRRGSSLIWDADMYSGQHWTKEMAMAAQAWMCIWTTILLGTRTTKLMRVTITPCLRLDSPRNVLSALG